MDYLAPPLVSAGSRLDAVLQSTSGDHSWTANYTYWLHTGAGWRGTIGKAVVRYRLADTFLGWGADITAEETGGRFEYELTKPPGWEQPDDSTYQWIFTDFEPVDSPYPLAHLPGEHGLSGRAGRRLKRHGRRAAGGDPLGGRGTPGARRDAEVRRLGA